MHRRTVPRGDPRYKQLRAQNNSSVKKSREKTRREREQTLEAINQLEKDNQQLLQSVRLRRQEYEQLQQLFKQHTGIDIEQMVSADSNSTGKRPTPADEPKENIAKPLLAINTAEKPSTTADEFDPNNLDGSVVLINGVQYKIVSMNNS